MQKYQNMGGDSAVKAYEMGEDFIKVQFSTGMQNVYTYDTAGRKHVEQMKKYARQGNYLNAYINIQVKKRYVK